MYTHSIDKLNEENADDQDTEYDDDDDDDDDVDVNDDDDVTIYNRRNVLKFGCPFVCATNAQFSLLREYVGAWWIGFVFSL